jgi:hypothetical protein
MHAIKNPLGAISDLPAGRLDRGLDRDNSFETKAVLNSN